MDDCQYFARVALANWQNKHFSCYEIRRSQLVIAELHVMPTSLAVSGYASETLGGVSGGKTIGWMG